MSHQFQYDNFVQSQIAVGNSNTYFSSGVGRQEDHHQKNHNGTNARNSLKQKINELLGLCQDENDGIKSQFQQVMGAEKDILNLMKEEYEEMPRFYNGVDNYARSNVQMLNGAGSGHEYAQRYNQGHFEGNGAGYLDQGHRQGHHNNGISHYNRPRSPEYQQQNEYHDPYYGQSNNYADDLPERANILKSKAQELKEENIRLKSLQSQYGQSKQDLPHYEKDPEIRQLQQEVNRLKQIVYDYENQLTNLNSGNAGDKASLLRQLKDQGERIRQDTLILLRGKALSPNKNEHSNNFQNQNNNYEETSHFRNPQTHIQTNAPNNPDHYQNYNIPYTQGNYANFSSTPEMISSVYRGVSGLSQDQQSQFRAQLAELRMECEQLQQENAGIKRNKANGRR